MNNNSKVLALKYRPKVFSDLIGQEVVAETIYNSIKYNRGDSSGFNRFQKAEIYTGLY